MPQKDHHEMLGQKMLDHPFDILGIGNPIVDFVIKVPLDFFSNISGSLSGMETITLSEMQELIDKSGQTPTIVAGGSCINTLKGLSHLGQKTAAVGMIGDDELASFFLNSLKEDGVVYLYKSCSTPTGRCLSIVAPNGDRTLRTFLGASALFNESHLRQQDFEGVNIVHIEGYALFNGSLAEQAMILAKDVGAVVSFDLASFEITKRYKEKILKLTEKYVDILISNSDESFALTGKNPRDAARSLTDLCSTAIVLLGKDGCLAATKDETISHETLATDVLDTTGAGDLFIAGFLHTYLQKRPLLHCVRSGSILAAAVISYFGAQIPHEQWESLLEKIEE